ncbi:MAG: hypothetical protein ACYSWZ_10100 [Planctomycetota bacterium]
MYVQVGAAHRQGRQHVPARRIGSTAVPALGYPKYTICDSTGIVQAGGPVWEKL